MSSDSSSLITIASSVWSTLQSSAFWSVFVWFLGIYGLILLADVILLLFLRDIPGDIKKTIYGNKRPAISHSKFFKRWEEVSSRLKSGNPSQYKAAVLEADAIADEMLAGMGYVGANMSERLSAIGEGHIESATGLRDAHIIRNRIIQDSEFVLSHEETEKTIDQYKRFFDELELL